MTCGGIFLAALLLMGSVALSNRLDSNWPIVVVLILIGLTIAWRVFEIYANRQRMRAFDRAFAPTWSNQAPSMASIYDEDDEDDYCYTYVKGKDGTCQDCGVHWYDHVK